MLKAIIFDLNGIFLVSEMLSVRFERDFKVPIPEFLHGLNQIMDQVRKPGAQPAFTYWKPYLDKWGIKLSEQEFWDYWFNAEKPSEEMLDLAKQIKAKGLKIFLLSNNFKERAEYYGHYRWMSDVIDNAYYSWKTGFVKPDYKAWENLLRENNLEPEDCMYFDDQEKNVKAAGEVGIKSYLFVDPNTTRNIIEHDSI